jgi:hypothetical protein
LVGVKVRMGCAPDIPLQRLQAFLGLLAEREPDLQPEVAHLPTAEQVRRLRDGGLDLGLLHDTGSAPGVEAEPVYRGEVLKVALSLSHRLTARESVRLEDLADDVLLVVPRRAEPGVHDRVVALATADDTRFREIREAPGTHVRDLLFAVASGHGVAVVARSLLGVAGQLGDAVAAHSLAPSTWMPDTCVAWPANARPELGALRGAARDVARELYRP